MSAKSAFPHRNPTPTLSLVPDWERHPTTNKWKCLVCHDQTYRERRHAVAHETTSAHQSALSLFHHNETTRAGDTQNNLNVFPPTPMDAFVANGTQHLVHSLAYGGLDSSEQPPPPPSIIPWNLDWLQTDDFSFDATEDQVATTRRVATELHEFLNSAQDEDSDNEQDVEWAAEDLEPEVVPEPTGIFDMSDTETELSDAQPRKRPRISQSDSAAQSRHWYPWADRITCTLDILMHLPRSVFSHRQLDLFLWLLRVNGVDDVPSVKKMIKLNETLQKACGIETLEYDGALGNKFYMNSLADIISQEMANPEVRPHLSFYPEDSGKRLSEARQASRWLHDAPDDQLTPMLRLGSQDYFIHEPAMTRNGTVLMPVRWFTRGTKVHAKCWQMEPLSLGTGMSWRVIRRNDYIISQDELMLNWPQLCESQAHNRYTDLPNFQAILELIDPEGNISEPWTLTDPKLGNRWRTLAKGNSVMGQSSASMVGTEDRRERMYRLDLRA